MCYNTPMSKRYLAVGGLLLTVFIWGTTFVATKVALRDMPPLTFTLLRFVLGALVLVPMAWAEHRSTPATIEWRPLFLAGLTGGCLYFALQNVGLVYTTASKASLILAGVPALTALLSVIFLGEPISRARALGVTASIVGVAVIILADRSATLSGGSLIGDLLMVATGASWAVYTVLSSRLGRSASPTLISAATFGFGALFMLPLAGYEALAQPAPTFTLAGALALGYLGLIASPLPFLLWNSALGQIDASEAAVYVNLVPVVAVASSVLLLGERIVLGQLLGGALVLAGVWAAGRQKGPRARGSGNHKAHKETSKP